MIGLDEFQAKASESADDSDEESQIDDDQDVVYNDPTMLSNIQEDLGNDLNDIREKTMEYDRQQIKGIHFANAGEENLRVVNSYQVASSTCILI
jgi:hypothetical protein